MLQKVEHSVGRVVVKAGTLALLALTWRCGEAESTPGAFTGPDIRLVSSTRQGAELKLVVESSVPLTNIWNPACNMAPVLRKQASGEWVELRDEFDLRYMLDNCPSNELQSKRWEIPGE